MSFLCSKVLLSITTTRLYLIFWLLKLAGLSNYKQAEGFETFPLLNRRVAAIVHNASIGEQLIASIGKQWIELKRISSSNETAECKCSCCFLPENKVKSSGSQHFLNTKPNQTNSNFLTGQFQRNSLDKSNISGGWQWEQKGAA